MFKKIAILGILMTIFIAGNLIANDRVWYEGEVETHGFANTLKVGYIDNNNTKYPQKTWQNVPSGTYPFGFDVYVWQPAPVKIYAEAWGPYDAYDYDEVPANYMYYHYLELWIGCTPPGEEDPEQ